MVHRLTVITPRIVQSHGIGYAVSYIAEQTTHEYYEDFSAMAAQSDRYLADGCRTSMQMLATK